MTWSLVVADMGWKDKVLRRLRNQRCNGGVFGVGPGGLRASAGTVVCAVVCDTQRLPEASLRRPDFHSELQDGVLDQGEIPHSYSSLHESDALPPAKLRGVILILPLRTPFACPGMGVRGAGLRAYSYVLPALPP